MNRHRIRLHVGSAAYANPQCEIFVSCVTLLSRFDPLVELAGLDWCRADCLLPLSPTLFSSAACLPTSSLFIPSLLSVVSAMAERVGSSSEEEETIAQDVVVTKYKMAADIANRG